MPFRIFGTTDYLRTESQAATAARQAGLNGYIHEPTGSPGSGTWVLLPECSRSESSQQQKETPPCN